MSDPAMQPEPEDPQLLGDAEPGTVTATMTWGDNGGVSIGLPNVDNSAPSSVNWDGSNTTESGGRWTSATSNATNSMVAMYGTTRYSNSSIARNAASAVLTKA